MTPEAKLRRLRRVVLPFVRFIARFDKHPLSQSGDAFYAIHSGTKHEATLKLSELRKLAKTYKETR